MLHFSKDLWKFIQIHPNYTMALMQILHLDSKSDKTHIE